jgi:hypothetical protein
MKQPDEALYVQLGGNRSRAWRHAHGMANDPLVLGLSSAVGKRGASPARDGFVVLPQEPSVDPVLEPKRGPPVPP